MGLIASKWFHDRLICLCILPHFVNESLHFVTLSRNLIPSCANLNFRQLQRLCLRSCLTEWIKYFTCLFSPIVPDQFYFWVQLYWTFWTDPFSGWSIQKIKLITTTTTDAGSVALKSMTQESHTSRSVPRSLERPFLRFGATVVGWAEDFTP